MKTAVYAALMGLTTAVQFAEGDTTPAWGLRTLTDHRLEAQTQIGFGNFATEQANARPPLRSHVQVESDSSSSDSDSDDDLIQQKDFFQHQGEGLQNVGVPGLGSLRLHGDTGVPR